MHVARALQHSGAHDLRAVVPETNRRPRLIPTWTYRFDPRTANTSVPLADHPTQRIARGLAVMEVLRALKNDGFSPDAVIGHGGWGETLFVRDVWPSTRVILYSEYYYRAQGGDVDFDPEFPIAELELRGAQARARNIGMSQALFDADVGVAPTMWQASTFPAYFQNKLSIIHEGVDTGLIRPDPKAQIIFNRDGTKLRAGDEVVTFVSRNLEPYRGYHVFMRALPEILARRPSAHAVIVGGDGVSYGRAPPSGKTWKGIFLKEVQGNLDMKRVHFVGRIPHPDFVRLMQISAAHVYLTYPFVLSWSMLEAMSAEALVIASRTPPVSEVLTDGVNGILFDFFDVKALVEAVADALTIGERHRKLRRNARAFVQSKFDLSNECLKKWLELIENI